jgi:hypothetical protein
MADHPKTRRAQVAAHVREMPLKTYDIQCAWCGKAATVERYLGTECTRHGEYVWRRIAVPPFTTW